MLKYLALKIGSPVMIYNFDDSGHAIFLPPNQINLD